ncbi:MAG: FkbM family methyltransferase [Nitratireductor sp.]
MATPRPPLDTTTPFGQRRPGFAATAAWRLATAGLLSPAARRLVRKRLAGRFDGPFDVEVAGLKLRAYPTENRDDRILLGRGTMPEPAELALIAPRLAPGMVFVDIGANVGTYALFVARTAGPSGRVLAFEPHPRTFAKLAFNVAANDNGAIVARNLAIAETAGTMTLHSDGGGNIGHASLLAEAAGTVRAGHEVAVRPLAAEIADQGLTRIDLLKIDVEGFEDRALLPFFDQAEPSLWPAAILIETVLSQLWRTDCLAVLAHRGYVVAGETAENVLLAR